MFLKYIKYGPNRNINKQQFLNYHSSLKDDLIYDRLLDSLQSRQGNLSVSEMEYAINVVQAGVGMFKPTNLISRAQGFLDFYKDCFPVNFMNVNCFMIPQGYNYDPTFLSHFSNLIGKAHTSILFKKLSQGFFTYNFEGYANEKGMKLIGSRPDLIGVSMQNKLFTLESKGWKNGGSKSKKLNAVKQSLSVNVNQQAGIAVISKRLYKNIEIEYIDPPIYGNHIKFNVEEIIESYYHIWKFLVDRSGDKYGPIEIDNMIFQVFDTIDFKNKKYFIGIDERFLNKNYQGVENFVEPKEDYFIDESGLGLFLIT
ncbi:Uncharacterised protein [Streptococcus milleri]|uniref:Uncharacterized protein n=1 Tax=Streptococcus milleri TaxID=33040 RepID=A0A380L546_9STRE|nr:Uncharacterised protein [Streptococcus milleri]